MKKQQEEMMKRMEGLVLLLHPFHHFFLLLLHVFVIIFLQLDRGSCHQVIILRKDNYEDMKKQQEEMMKRVEEQYKALHQDAVATMAAQIAALQSEKAARMMAPPPSTPAATSKPSNAPASAPPAAATTNFHTTGGSATNEGITVNITNPTPPSTPVADADVSALIAETFTKEAIDQMVNEQRMEGGMCPSFKKHLKALLLLRANDTTSDAAEYRAYVDKISTKKTRNANVAGSQFKNQLVLAAKLLAATGKATKETTPAKE